MKTDEVLRREELRTDTRLRFATTPATNFTCAFGESPTETTVSCQESKTVRNRIKWWLFCKAFPVRVVKWEKKE